MAVDMGKKDIAHEQVKNVIDPHGNFNLIYTYGDETRAVIFNPETGETAELAMNKKAYRAMLLTALNFIHDLLKTKKNGTNRS